MRITNISTENFISLTIDGFYEMNVLSKWNYKTLHTPWNTVQGEGQIPEMIQVCDYNILIVLGELNKLI